MKRFNLASFDGQDIDIDNNVTMDQLKENSTMAHKNMKYDNVGETRKYTLGANSYGVTSVTFYKQGGLCLELTREADEGGDPPYQEIDRHLSREEAKELGDLLTHYAEHGELPVPGDIKWLMTSKDS